MTNAELLSKIKAEIERLKGICTAQITANPEQTFPFVMEMTGYDKLLSFLSTIESEKTISPWMRNHTYTEEIHEGDMEKMLLELSVGKGEKRTKTALPDRIVDILESEKPMNPNDAMKELDEKIALVKQRGTWDGVDVDKYMDEVRGREPEKSMNQDGLLEEVKRYYSDNFEYLSSDQPTLSILTNVARHFAQWGAEHAKTESEKPVPADLEEAADEMAIRAFPEKKSYSTVIDRVVDYNAVDRKNYRDGIIAGAKWQEVIDKLNSM